MAISIERNFGQKDSKDEVRFSIITDSSADPLLRISALYRLRKAVVEGLQPLSILQSSLNALLEGQPDKNENTSRRSLLLHGAVMLCQTAQNRDDQIRGVTWIIDYLEHEFASSVSTEVVSMAVAALRSCTRVPLIAIAAMALGSSGIADRIKFFHKLLEVTDDDLFSSKGQNIAQHLISEINQFAVNRNREVGLVTILRKPTDLNIGLCHTGFVAFESDGYVDLQPLALSDVMENLSCVSEGSEWQGNDWTGLGALGLFEITPHEDGLVGRRLVWIHISRDRLDKDQLTNLADQLIEVGHGAVLEVVCETLVSSWGPQYRILRNDGFQKVLSQKTGQVRVGECRVVHPDNPRSLYTRLLLSPRGMSLLGERAARSMWPHVALVVEQWTDGNNNNRSRLITADGITLSWRGDMTIGAVCGIYQSKRPFEDGSPRLIPFTLPGQEDIPDKNWARSFAPTITEAFYHASVKNPSAEVAVVVDWWEDEGGSHCKLITNQGKVIMWHKEPSLDTIYGVQIGARWIFPLINLGEFDSKKREIIESFIAKACDNEEINLAVVAYTWNDDNGSHAWLVGNKGNATREHGDLAINGLYGIGRDGHRFVLMDSIDNKMKAEILTDFFGLAPDYYGTVLKNGDDEIGSSLLVSSLGERWFDSNAKLKVGTPTLVARTHDGKPIFMTLPGLFIKNACGECYNTGYRLCPTCHGTNKTECSNCYGRGEIEATCGGCKGTGNHWLTCTKCTDGRWSDGRICPKCGGEGKFPVACRYCDGTGKQSQKCKKCYGTGLSNCEECLGDRIAQCDCHRRARVTIIPAK